MLDYVIASSHDQGTGRVWVLKELSEPPTLPAKTLGYLLFKNSTLIWEKDELDEWRAEDKDLPCLFSSQETIDMILQGKDIKILDALQTLLTFLSHGNFYKLVTLQYF